MATRGSRGVSRVLEKLEACVNSGEYYEAHQMYRTLYFRYLGQKKYEDLLDLLYKGSTLLLQRDQQSSGADIGILLIDVLTKSETKPNTEWIDKITSLFELMHPSTPERETFLTNAVKWSMDGNKKGHPLLHKKIAEVYWKEKKFTSAHKHFLHSNDGATYAKMLIELHTNEKLKTEIDFIITEAILQILCRKNLQMANDTLNEYTKSHPAIKSEKGPPYSFPLLNFVWYLLRAVETKNAAQFQLIRNYHAANINKDPSYTLYLDNIGQIWFDIPVPQKNKNPNSIFDGLMKTLIESFDSSDDDGSSNHTTANPSIPDLD